MGLPAQQHAAASPALGHNATDTLASPSNPSSATFSLYPSAFEHPCLQRLEGTNLPVLPFMASRSSRFSFRSNTSSLRIDAFSFSSFSFSVRNRLASSSARFFPYLY